MEDMQLAMSLLNRYQKDKNFIGREDKELKRKSELLNVRGEEEQKKPTKPTVDPALIHAERHKLV